MKLIVLVLYLITSISALALTFDQSMGKKEEDYKFYFAKETAEKEYNFFKKLYNDNIKLLHTVKDNDEYKIPQILHYIWLSPEPISQKQLALINSCRNLHPNWEHKLWLKEDIDKLDFPEKDLVEISSIERERIEILKLALLNKYGGLFLDNNIKCFKPFDILNKAYESYISLQSINKHWEEPVFSTSVIASKANNKIFKEALSYLKDNWFLLDAYIDESHYEKNDIHLNRVQRIIKSLKIGFFKLTTDKTNSTTS